MVTPTTFSDFEEFIAFAERRDAGESLEAILEDATESIIAAAEEKLERADTFLQTRIATVSAQIFHEMQQVRSHLIDRTEELRAGTLEQQNLHQMLLQSLEKIEKDGQMTASSLQERALHVRQMEDYQQRLKKTLKKPGRLPASIEAGLYGFSYQASIYAATKGDRL